MEELIGRITSAVGIDEGLASNAIRIILNLLQSAGPEDKVSQLIELIPGASELIGDAGGEGSGILGGLGGAMGAMGALNELKGEGLSMDQIQGIGSEVLGFAKEKAGEDLVGDVVSNIPGLENFL